MLEVMRRVDAKHAQLRHIAAGEFHKLAPGLVIHFREDAVTVGKRFIHRLHEILL
jgi:hypothetical protein